MRPHSCLILKLVFHPWGQEEIPKGVTPKLGEEKSIFPSPATPMVKIILVTLGYRPLLVHLFNPAIVIRNSFIYNLRLFHFQRAIDMIQKNHYKVDNCLRTRKVAVWKVL